MNKIDAISMSVSTVLTIVIFYYLLIDFTNWVYITLSIIYSISVFTVIAVLGMWYLGSDNIKSKILDGFVDTTNKESRDRYIYSLSTTFVCALVFIYYGYIYFSIALFLGMYFMILRRSEAEKYIEYESLHKTSEDSGV